MQTVETLNEGLKRNYTLTITADEIRKRIDKEVADAAPRVNMPGFRPGKVPAKLVQKMYGASIAQDALNGALQEGVQQLLSEKGVKPAMQPEIELAEGYELGKDAELKVKFEILPEIPEISLDALKLERLTVEASTAIIDEKIQEFATQQKSFDDAPEGHAAEKGDLVVIDFVGKVDGEAFDGGTGSDMSVEIGAGQFIPGFEDQLVGIKQGDSRVLKVSFPEDYSVPYLKGKAAEFDVTASDVRIPHEAKVDDEFAKSLGLESLDQLRDLMKGQIEQELNGLTRTHMKRKLLDQLADSYNFEVPSQMVEAEFNQIWQQLEHAASHEEDSEAALAEMEKERPDYRAIAERRVRLGLALSDIGTKNNVEVTSSEMNMLISQAAQRYNPADRQRFMEYLRQEPMAAAQLRAPLYEDKVVDLLFEKAEITDRAVTREELEAAIEADDDSIGKAHNHDHDHDHDHDHAKAKPKAKKASSKKKEKEAKESEEKTSDSAAK
ncbi:trigger factor [Zymomonas mobilis]|uniref:Trigger factor n=1 Tax=Zymomonas mobilis subsp. pomaceae (strain ATCC 29192 / DSM 22645 / JCM 10191 / CCUG 17912 / NBRC 13757 / NCIMB 11200 / NRRL B-4491 / Barker I) TaxID=579138 RepID=F8EUL1_ZYMMT|nr:trigger factor [Zymomonas mobilis]AEI37227.1 trigger factor [Zymomonas mobilis subsp. pomaceae ATCC 29192]MDX5948597.1 trigger factor [Zymomonas mobilis subsp. pomaceae]GEB88403.1 trigger factor [Zymomonas mobilis subsp. pomaceae]